MVLLLWFWCWYYCFYFGVGVMTLWLYAIIIINKRHVPFTCKECEQNQKNYRSETSGDTITYISASGKECQISSNTVLDIINPSKIIMIV